MLNENTWRKVREAFAAGAIEYHDDEVSAFNTAAGLPPIPRPERPEDFPAFEVRESARPTLEDAQAFVGGYVELIEVRVRLRDGRTVPGQLIGNDEARLHNMFLNHAASAIYGHPFAGPALLLLGPAMWD